MTSKFQKAAIALAVQSVIFSGAVMAEENEQDEATLEKIVVTAQKREQSAQEVPISVSTMFGEQFDNMFASGDDILAVATRVPGLYAESSNGRIAPRFYMRGLGNADFDLAASQPVSIIMDDVVLENVVLKSFPLFDIEGMEVIRGPQGTLFGRNTTAGIVKFTSRKPTEDLDGYVKLGLGERGTVNFEGAVGGEMADGLTARVSGLILNRDDWVTNGFTGSEDVLGGFEETAARMQFNYKVNDDLNIYLNIHNRDYNGTSTMFRANILTTGSNELNQNFNRDVVYYDEGDNNPQEYEGNGGILKIDYDMGDVTFSSITATASAEGSGIGDIDGGNMVTGPGFIPFPSVTRDSADVEQFTQEFRFASDTDGDITWQTGFFYFDSELEVFTEPFFVDGSTVTQENTTWALFGQATYAMTEKTTLVGGLRYTDDEKSAISESGAGIPIDPVNLDDSQWSFEVSVNHQLTDKVSYYGRFANGFRAQSIQARDVAFFGTPSVAESETIMSFEVGFKADMFDDTFRLNGALFSYEVDDLQLTAVGGNGNNVGLTNAQNGIGQGFELDSTWYVNEYVQFTAGFSYNDTEIDDPNLLIATCGSGQCTVIDPIATDNAGNSGAVVDGNPFPQAPETIFNITGRFSYPIESGEFYAFVDYARQGDTNLFIYDTVEYSIDPQFEVGLRLGYINQEHNYEVAAFARNLTDEENLKGGVDFNNNTAFVNEPRIIGVEFKKNFN